MNGNRTVKVAFCCPHLDGDGYTLNHFIRLGADDVASNNLFVLAHRHKLKHGCRFAFSHGMKHVGKACLIYFYFVFALLIICFVFRHADGTQRWMTEDYGWNVFVIKFGIGLVIE